MTHDVDDHEEGATRRKVLERRPWAAAYSRTLAGGIPRSTGLIGEAKADEIDEAFSFLQSATAISASTSG